MDELDTPLTPIEESRAATGFRYYKFDPAVYGFICTAVDESRGYPKRYTHRALPLAEALPDATDGSGKLIAVDCWRFNAGDDELLSGPIAAGTVTEITKEAYDALKPQPTEEL